MYCHYCQVVQSYVEIESSCYDKQADTQHIGVNASIAVLALFSQQIRVGWNVLKTGG